jgi:cell shape-determining protein MreC
MSVISETLGAIKEALKLAGDVKRTGETLKELSKELREHDRRITRLEAQWETALALRGSPRRLEGN